jgi:photosystem II stability/assembly factor-like uncharacterized protein
MRDLHKVLLTVLFGLSVATAGLWPQRTAVLAQGPPSGSEERLFAHLRWRNIGPLRGGRSIAVAGSVKRPLEYYFGATGGGLWKTTDAGTTWRPVSDGFFKTSSVGAVAVADSNPDLVYAGMGETKLRGDIIMGDGVYKSTDGGRTWTHAGLADTQTIARIRIHPANADVVYVAAFGHPGGPNDERGVFRSTDGGKTWNNVLSRGSKAGAIELCLDPKNPQILYASTWEAYRVAHTFWSGGPGSGLFKSTDGGETWTELTRNPGMPKGLIGKIGIAVAGGNSNRLYALVEAENGGLFVSDDAGATWTLVNAERRLRHRAYYYGLVYADPVDPLTIYVPNTGFYRSTDGGKRFRSLQPLHGDSHDMWIAPNDPRRMIASNDGGASVSTNGGQTWTSLVYSTAQFYNAFTTKDVPYHVCGAQQDNSTSCVPSDGRGDVFYGVGGGESGYIAPDPRNPGIFYSGSYGGTIDRFDRQTRQRVSVDVWPENERGYAARDLPERFQWTAPIVFSPVDPRILYTSSQHLWRTTSEGRTWEQISPDLTRHDPSRMGPAGGPLTPDMSTVEVYGTIFTVAPSRHDASTIWTGSDDGLVHVTRDGGRNWENVTPTDLPEFSRVSLIEASPHKPGAAYLAANRYQYDDFGPYVFKTGDYGKTWTTITSGLPADDFARAIREDTKRPGLLYLGTERSVYVSFDDGASWQSLRLNLPVTPVHGIVVEEKDLVIGTHGRGFYILDGIAALRQLTPEVASAAVYLFKPADTIRSVDRGAFFDYVLGRPASTVTIEVADGTGQVIRAFAGRAGATRPGPPPEEDEVARFRPSSPSVPVDAGSHRVVWDLRWRDATYLPGQAYSARGPIVPPGTYTIKLTADGETRTQQLVVRKHPGIEAGEADLQEQFTLAKSINDAIDLTNRTLSRIVSVKEQLKDRAARAKQPPLRAAIDTLDKRLTLIRSALHAWDVTRPGDTLRAPLKAVEKLSSLQETVESGDGRPTAQAQAVFKKLRGLLDEQVTVLTTVLESDVPALNKMLAREKLEPVGNGNEVRRPAPQTPVPGQAAEEQQPG